MPEYHAKRSPSGGAKRMLYCAAAPEREAHYPDTTTQVPPEQLTRRVAAAQWGTASHAILEAAVRTTEELGTPVPCTAIPPAEAYPSEEYLEMQRVAQVAYDYVYKKVQDLRNRGIPVSVRAEGRVYPGKLIGVEDDLDGTADVTIITDEFAETIDLKTGRGFVPADDEQLAYYSAGTLVEYLDANGACSFERLISTIVQPLGESGEAIRSHEYTPIELISWMNNTVKPAYVASLDPNAPATPSVKGCKWCRVVDCQERADWVVSGATQVNQPVTVNEPHIPDISTLSDEQVQAAYDHAPLLESWLKIVKGHIESTKKQDPSRFPRVKFVEKVGNKTWLLGEDQIAIKLKNQKMKKAEYTKTVLKSPTQVLAAASDRQKEFILDKLVHRPITGTKLVYATRDEEEVNPNALGLEIPAAKPEAQPDPLACLN